MNAKLTRKGNVKVILSWVEVEKLNSILAVYARAAERASLRGAKHLPQRVFAEDLLELVVEGS